MKQCNINISIKTGIVFSGMIIDTCIRRGSHSVDPSVNELTAIFQQENSYLCRIYDVNDEILKLGSHRNDEI